MPLRQYGRAGPRESEGARLGPAHNTGTARMGPPLGNMLELHCPIGRRFALIFLKGWAVGSQGLLPGAYRGLIFGDGVSISYTQPVPVGSPIRS